MGAIFARIALPGSRRRRVMGQFDIYEVLAKNRGTRFTTQDLCRKLGTSRSSVQGCMSRSSGLPIQREHVREGRLWVMRYWVE